MRLNYILLVLIVTAAGFSQNKFDTLFFGTKKYPLQKVKVFHESSQQGPVYLPSEYKNIEIKNWDDVPFFKYKQLDTIIGIENDDDGNLIMTSRWEFKCDTASENKYFLSYLLDTVTIAFKDFGKIVPYIKSGNKKINFSSTIVNVVYKGQIKKYEVYYLNPNANYLGWNMFSCWSEDKDKSELKSSTLILSGLYYLRGKETYYLNRKFVILVK